MSLVKKCNFFHFLFSVKIRLEIRLNDAVDRKETSFFTIRKIFEGLKNGIFPKGLTHAFGKKKCNFFNFFFLTKIRLEIRFNNVLDRKKNSLWLWNQNFSESQKSYFSKGVNPCFRSKNVFFLYFFSVEKRTRNKVYDVLDRNETFYDYKKNNFLTTQKWHFFKGVNPCFDRIMQFFFLCFRSKRD